LPRIPFREGLHEDVVLTKQEPCQQMARKCCSEH
jgi:hypothetical protein